MTESAAHAELFQDATYASPTKECDVVMKGGITSGVVYPLAICELARDHRLRAVAGSSAGAIAAAAAAAAECGRKKGPGAGFSRLASLPDKLAKHEGGRSRLFSLFQPNPETRGVFGILSAVIFDPPEKKGSGVLESCLEGWRDPRELCKDLGQRAGHAAHRSPLRKTLPVLFALFRAYPGWCLTSVAPLFFLAAFLEGMALNHAFPTGASGFLLGVAWIVPIWLILFAAILAFPVRKAILRAIEDNGFGLTTGYLPKDSRPLTSFLCEELDGLAGKDGDGHEPATLGDLEGAEVELEVLTTNLTLGRPYSIPFQGREFHWDPDELSRYFPPYVIEHMRKSSKKVESEARIHDEPGIARSLYTLPAKEHLPLVFGARLSLSFPGLISAVPLYKRQWLGKREKDGKLPWIRCWFSDGGISSNLPVHVFDEAMPARPTFAINLRDTSRLDEDPSKNVRLPRGNSGGIQYRPRRIEGVLSFLSNVLATMQNWADDMQLRAPGSRDRVATIYHSEAEGGLNLDMPEDKIRALTDRGAVAGKKFATEFDWTNHRWIRFRSSMRLASRWTRSIHANSGDELRDMISSAPSYKIRPKAQQQQAARALKKVEELGSLEDHKDSPFKVQRDKRAPKPLLSLKSVPKP